MFKTGICTIKDLKNKDCHYTWMGKQKNISITLYDQIQNEDNVDELAEQILLLSADDRGAYKRTYSKRFEVFDEHVIQHLKSYFKDKDFELLIYDVAVSDGRTAGDFFQKLIQYFPNIKYQASDYNPYLYSIKKGRLTVTLSDSYKPIEILYPPFVFNLTQGNNYLYYPINYCLLILLQLTTLPKVIRLLKQDNIRAKKLLVFHPRIIKLAQQDQRFSLSKHSVLDPFDKKVHVVRAMNILNINYFDDKMFKQILINIHNGLQDNGFLITGSNQEAGSTVHGGLYQKTHQGFILLWQSGEGSPIKEFISTFTMD